jgi:hypothetical protein
MSADDTLVALCTRTGLTTDDLEGLRACNPAQIAVLMKVYEDAGKVRSTSTWEDVGSTFLQIGAYAGAGAAILGFALAARGI